MRKAITIMQPHAWAVMYGDKPFENRSWFCHHRGWLIIHAGKSRRWMEDEDWDGPPEYRQYDGQPPGRELFFGHILGVVKVVDCRPPEACNGHPTAEGPWCHVYANRIALPRPIPWPGAQGLWTAPTDLEAMIREQLARLEVPNHA